MNGEGWTMICAVRLLNCCLILELIMFVLYVVRIWRSAWRVERGAKSIGLRAKGFGNMKDE